MSDTSHYDTLGVSRDAGQDEVEQAYRRLRKRVHPDAQGSHGLFIQVQHAYETLSDPDKRRAYDAGLESRVSGGGPTSGRARSESSDQHDHADWSFGPPPAIRLPEQLPRLAVAVRYDPPLQRTDKQAPTPQRVHRVAGWAKITAAVIASVGVLIGLITMINGLGSSGVSGRTVTNAVVITVFFLIIAGLPMIISKSIPRRPSAPPLEPVAADVLLPEHVERRVFGRPGADRPAGPDPVTQRARWGAERTAHFLQQTLLPAVPSARLLHGVRLGEGVDHVIVVGDRVLLVASLLVGDGSYGWDGHQVLAGGRPIATPDLMSALADATQLLGAGSTSPVIQGFLLLHSDSEDPARPRVDQRPRADRDQLGGGPVLAGNPEQFLVTAYRFLTEADDPALVDVRLIRALLTRSDVD